MSTENTSIEKQSNVVYNVLGAVKIKSGKINFKSRKFKKALKQIKEENDKIDKARKVDTIKMLRRFDV